MNDDIKLSKLFDAVDHLRTIQTNFRDTGLLAGLEMDVNKDSIVISFDADSDYTVTLSTDYEYGVLTGLEIKSIEVDSSFGTYTVADTDDTDDNEMLHEAKRLIHDAVYYKLIDEDCEIETNFYDDVYA